MSRLFDGTGDWLTCDAPLTSNVLTMACWYKRSALAQDILVQIGVSGGGDYNAIFADNTPGAILAISKQTTSTSAASGTTQTDLTTWHHACGRFLSPTLRYSNLDGGTRGQQVSSRTPAGTNSMRIGAGLDGAAAFSGRIGHVAVWDIALSDSEVAQLQTQLPTAVQPVHLVFYAPLTQNRNPEIDDIGGLELVVTNATFDTDNPPIGPPIISAIGTMQQGQSLTITGTTFKPGATAPTVTMGGVAQTVNTSSDTSITINSVTRGTAKYGVQDVQVTNSLGLSDSAAAPFLPPTTFNYVDLLAPLAASAQRVTASADIAAGDQIAWSNVIGGALSDVTVLSDASFFCDDAVTSFDVEDNDGTGWGTVGTQTLEDPLLAPTLVGTIPDFAFETGTDVQFDVADNGVGWASITINTTLPTGLTNTAGVITGNVASPSSTTHTVTYTNAAGSVTSASFALVFTDPVVAPPPNEVVRFFVTTQRGVRDIKRSPR